MATRLSELSERQLAIVAACLVVGTALSLLRTRGAGALDTLWAEDGAIFLQDALRDPRRSPGCTDTQATCSGRPLLGTLAALVPLRVGIRHPLRRCGPGNGRVALVTYRQPGNTSPLGGCASRWRWPSSALSRRGDRGGQFRREHPLVPAVRGRLGRALAPREPRRMGRRECLAAPSGHQRSLRTLSRARGRARWLQARGDRATWLRAALGPGLVLQAASSLANRGSRRSTRRDEPRSIWRAGTASTCSRRPRSASRCATRRSPPRVRLAPAVLALGVCSGSCLRRLHSPRAGGPACRSRSVLTVVYFVAPALLAGLSSSRYTVAPILLLYAADRLGSRPAAPGVARPLGRVALALLALTSALDFAPANRRARGASVERRRSRRRGARCAHGARAAASILVPPLRRTPCPPRTSSDQRVWSVEVPCPMLADGGPR